MRTDVFDMYGNTIVDVVEIDTEPTEMIRVVNTAKKIVNSEFVVVFSGDYPSRVTGFSNDFDQIPYLGCEQVDIDLETFITKKHTEIEYIVVGGPVVKKRIGYLNALFSYPIRDSKNPDELVECNTEFVITFKPVPYIQLQYTTINGIEITVDYRSGFSLLDS